MVAALGVARAGADQHEPPADSAAIEATIQAQIDAFLRDDAEAAFAFAAPGIQSKFGTPAQFVRMVAAFYAPVYRPREITFGRLGEVRGRTVQEVSVVGSDGVPVLAYYFMLEIDGGWRIDGCTIVPYDGSAT